MSAAMISCQRSYYRAPWTEGVAAADRVNLGRTTSRNGRASRCRYCSALHRTGIDGQASQQRHLLGYPTTPGRHGFWLIGWLNSEVYATVIKTTNNRKFNAFEQKILWRTISIDRLLPNIWTKQHSNSLGVCRTTAAIAEELIEP